MFLSNIINYFKNLFLKNNFYGVDLEKFTLIGYYYNGGIIYFFLNTTTKERKYVVIGKQVKNRALLELWKHKQIPIYGVEFKKTCNLKEYEGDI